MKSSQQAGRYLKWHKEVEARTELRWPGKDYFDGLSLDAISGFHGGVCSLRIIIFMSHLKSNAMNVLKILRVIELSYNAELEQVEHKGH